MTIRVDALALLLATTACAKTTPTVAPTVPVMSPEREEVVPPPDAPATAPPLQIDGDPMPLCRAIMDDEELEITECAFVRDGQDLPGGGRVDVVQLGYDADDLGPVVEAYIILRSTEDVGSQVLGTISDVPGERWDYTLGELRVEGSVAVIRSTETCTNHANTGEPDEPPDESEEVVEYETRCSLEDDWPSCSREPVD